MGAGGMIRSAILPHALLKHAVLSLASTYVPPGTYMRAVRKMWVGTLVEMRDAVGDTASTPQQGTAAAMLDTIHPPPSIDSRIDHFPPPPPGEVGGMGHSPDGSAAGDVAQAAAAK